jgi:hypothetical protein
MRKLNKNLKATLNMKIELEEREVDTLPNDMELGKYVRFKMNEAKKLQTTTITNGVPSWTTTTTWDGEVNIDWHPDSNGI